MIRRLAGLLVCFWLSVGEDASAQTAEPSHVGSAACGQCHAAETRAWRGSHHDLAMQEATEATVLGDFADATFTHGGVTANFSDATARAWTRSTTTRRSARVGCSRPGSPAAIATARTH